MGQQLARRDQARVGADAQWVVEEFSRMLDRVLGREERGTAEVERHLELGLVQLPSAATAMRNPSPPMRKLTTPTASHRRAPTTNGRSSCSSATVLPAPMPVCDRYGRQRYRPMSMLVSAYEGSSAHAMRRACPPGRHDVSPHDAMTIMAWRTSMRATGVKSVCMPPCQL